MALDRAIRFSGPSGGYLKARGVSLGTNSTFEFNFRTRSRNAILVYQSARLQAAEEERRMRRRRRRRRNHGEGHEQHRLSRFAGDEVIS